MSNEMVTRGFSHESVTEADEPSTMNQRGLVRLYCHTYPGRIKRWIGLALIMLALSLLGGRPVISDAGAQSPNVRIAVIKSLDLPQYNSAYEGFIAALTGAGYVPEPMTVTLEGDDIAVRGAVRALCAAKPDLILALGTRAVREVASQEKEIPIVYSMVLNSPKTSGKGRDFPVQNNLTGASLNIPLSIQIEHVQKVFPAAKHVGILSNPARTKELVASAIKAARAQDMDVRVEWVKNEAEIPDAIRALADSIDVLWMMPDETVFTPRSSRYIIFELIKAGVPIMGLSSAYVKAGAVIALDCDYTDVGRQSGELAVRILAGQSPSTLSQTSPRVFTVALNTKVKEHLKIALDEAAVAELNVVEF